MAFPKIETAIRNLVQQCGDEFVKRVAADYGLNELELRAKYTEIATEKTATASKKRKASVVVTDETGNEVKKTKGGCKGITSKNEPCKFGPLKGGCYCKRHQKAHDDAGTPKEAAPKPKPAPKQPAETPLEHEHEVDDKQHDSCNLCQTHGPIFGGVFDVEYVPEPEPATSIAPADHSPGLQEEEFSDGEGFPTDV